MLPKIIFDLILKQNKENNKSEEDLLFFDDMFVLTANYIEPFASSSGILNSDNSYNFELQYSSNQSLSMSLLSEYFKNVDSV